MTCCKTYLGDYPHNEPVNTGITMGDPITDIGDWIVLLDFQGSKIKKVVAMTGPDDELIIPLPFNENYNYNLTITKPDGSLYQTADGCTNFGFKTYVSITPDCNGSVCDNYSNGVYS